MGLLIAEDEPLLRGGLRAILGSEPGFHVVAEASDGYAAVEAARRLRPDVVLMDIHMPGLDGIEATRRLAGPGVEDPVRVVVLSAFDLDEYVHHALRAGASGFLLKDATVEELCGALRVVAAGEALLAPRVTRRLIERFARLPHCLDVAPPELARLTPRETEVLELLTRGLTNADIAGRLYVSEATVKTHVRSVLAKLGLRDRLQAVIFAYEAGLITPGRRDGN